MIAWMNLVARSARIVAGAGDPFVEHGEGVLPLTVWMEITTDRSAPAKTVLNLRI